MELKIDPEFQSKIPPLTTEEFDQLKENILEAGEVYEPIVIWNGVIVDGHNRWKIIQENPGLIWKTKEIDFPDKWAAFDWMYKNQLGRRNLTEPHRAYMIGKMKEARKKSCGGQGANQYTVLQPPQNGGTAKGGTAQSIAAELGIGVNTVERAEKFAAGIDAIREVSPETADKVLSGKIKPTRTDVASIAKAEPEERPRMVEQIEKGEKITPVAVPDKIVHKPEAKYTGGGTAEYRAKRDEIAETVARMYDPDSVPEYGIDDFLKEIGWNADLYIKQLRNSITDHLELVKSNREVVIGIIDEIKEDIEKIKGAIDK
jgi:hypothetical protein